MSIGRLGRISKLVGIVASCVGISFNVFADRRKVIVDPIYLGSILTSGQQEKVVEVYNAFKENSVEKQTMLINLSDEIGIKDEFVSEDEERIICGEFAQLIIGETEKHFGKKDIDEIDVATYWNKIIQEKPYLARDELVRAAFDCAFDQISFKGQKNK